MRLLGWAFRIGITVFGLWYAIHCIEWADSVRLPANTWPGIMDTSVGTPSVRCRIVDRTGSVLEVVEPSGTTRAVDLTALHRDGVDPEIAVGLRTSLVTAHVPWLILGLLAMAPIFLLQTLRWRSLVIAQGIRIPFFTQFRFHLASSFIGTFMLGALGGDIARTYWLCRHGVERMTALASVVVDRCIGISSMLAIGGLCLAFSTRGQAHDSTHILVIILAMMVGALIYYSLAVRRALGLSALMRLLNRVTAFDRMREAAVVYRHRGTAMLIACCCSLASFAALLIGSCLCALAVGITAPLPILLFSLTLSWLVGSLPISIMGFGVMEPLAMSLLVRDGWSTGSQVVAMLLLARFLVLLHLIPGAVALMWDRRHPQESIPMSIAS